MPALLDTGALELLRRRDRRVEALAIHHCPPLITTDRDFRHMPELNVHYILPGLA